MEEKKILIYRGRPLVRKGNLIYYGHMFEDVVVLLTVVSSKKVKDISISDAIQIQLMQTDVSANPENLIIKHTVKNGLFEALDIASIWIERYSKKSSLSNAG